MSTPTCPTPASRWADPTATRSPPPSSRAADPAYTEELRTATRRHRHGAGFHPRGGPACIDDVGARAPTCAASARFRCSWSPVTTMTLRRRRRRSWPTTSPTPRSPSPSSARRAWHRSKSRTVALLNRGVPSFAVEPDGTLHTSLMRSCTGWPSGVWIDARRRTAPDGSNFQLQHWTHTFDYALVAGDGDWRAARSPPAAPNSPGRC